jgi:hypothetical protein
MPHNQRWVVVVPIVAGLYLSACQRATSETTKIEPARVEHIEGTDLSRIILTPKAAERLGIATAQVQEMGSAVLRSVQLTRSGSAVKVVPYAAVLYDAHGDTWVYTSPEPLVFIRHRITVDHIEGDVAVLSDGPAVGTAVVTFGAAELFGTEFEVGH